MKRMCAFLLALCLLSGCGQGASTAAWQEQYDLGARYLSEGNYQEAILAFTAAIEIDPRQAPAYVGRGDAYRGSGGEDADLTAALADYEQALALDGTQAETYRKAAEVCVLLGDTEAAIQLLQRGVEATGDAELQTYLENLTAAKTLTLLTYQAAYHPDGTLWGSWSYFYDAQGYLIRLEEWSDSGRCMTETWTPDPESGMWLYTPDRAYFDSDEEWEAAREYLDHWPGVNTVWGGTYGGTHAAVTDPLMEDSQRELVLENGGILYSEEEDENNWDHAVYTFSENGLPVGITTYQDGAVTGTAVLEWTCLTL